MSLTAREQRALHGIEDWLAGSDPGLASRLATFTRLTCSEEMPAREKIQRGRRRALRRPRRHRRGLRRDGVFQHAGRLCQRLGWQRAMLLLCLTMAVVEGIVVALAIGRNGPEAPLDAPGPATWSSSVCPVARKHNLANAAGGARSAADDAKPVTGRGDAGDEFAGDRRPSGPGWHATSAPGP